MRGDVASEDGEKPLEIHLYADSDARTFTIQVCIGVLYCVDEIFMWMIRIMVLV
jgi:hypothetical protein